MKTICSVLGVVTALATHHMTYFEFDFIESIRRDEEVDNIGYLVDMCDIYTKLKDAKAEEENG